MKKIIILSLLGLGACNTPEINCWYVRSQTQQVGEPYFELMGRTNRFNPEVSGPLFRIQDELNNYISKHSLQMCGAK